MIKVFEMFSGYGGASFGLQRAAIPFECIGISEVDKYAIECFNNNFPNVKNFGDCSKIDTKELPDFDLLTGGFPCQDVSVAGKRNLEKGRTNLYEEILRIAKDKKPKYMLLENVKGLLSMEVDERKLHLKIVSNLNKIGYDVCWKVLNSKNHGIPQNRERIWFVCKLGSWKFMEFMFPNPIELKIFLKDILEKEVDKKYFLSDTAIKGIIKSNFQERKPLDNLDVCKTLKVGGDVPCLENPHSIAIRDKNRNNNNPKSELQLEINKGNISNAITSSTKDFMVIEARSRMKYNELSDCSEISIRKLTPTECFRLMGFLNDEINLDGLSDTQKYKLVGNGWDINLVSKILKNMLKTTKEVLE